MTDGSEQRNNFSHQSTSEKSTARSASKPSAGFTAPFTADHLGGQQIGRFGEKNGVGWAAEDVNTLYDRLHGQRAEVVGGDNAKNGADRMLNGQPVQTKYHSSAASTVGDAFGSDGMYRYCGSMLEVPADQYDDAVRIMRKRIEQGRVPGVTNPDDASTLVKKGTVTYKQAQNIAKAGTVDSLKYDALNGVVVSAAAFGIGFAISFAKAKWDGVETGKALRESLKSGGYAAGAAFITHVVASQLLRTQAARVGTQVAKKGLEAASKTDFGRTAIDKLASVSMGTAVDGAKAVNQVSKMLRTSVITGAVTTVVMTVPETYRAITGRASWAQASKTLMVNGASAAGGTLGWGGGAIAGAAVGSAVPIIGTAAGAIVGGIAGSLAGGWGAGAASRAALNLVIEDDAREMVTIVATVLVELGEDYLMSEAEFGQLQSEIRSALTQDWLRDMYACEDRRQYVLSVAEPICEELVLQRNPVKIPSLKEIQLMLELIKCPPEVPLEDVYDPGAYVPNFVVVGTDQLEGKSIALVRQASTFSVLRAAGAVGTFVNGLWQTRKSVVAA